MAISSPGVRSLAIERSFGFLGTLPYRLKISGFFNLCLHWVSVVRFFFDGRAYKRVAYASMTTLLTHTDAHSTKPSFRPKTNNQPLKKFLSLALS